MTATRVEIDLNVRVRGNLTYVGVEDADGAVVPGDVVEVFESESGLEGSATVTEVDNDRGLVYLDVRWAELRPAALRPSDLPSFNVALARRGWAQQLGTASVDPTMFVVHSSAQTGVEGQTSSAYGRPPIDSRHHSVA